MATERTYFNNGRFYTDLSDWTATNAVYLSSDGDEHFGMASISVGGSIAQSFNVPEARQYTLHIAVKPATTLTAGQATVVITQLGNAVTSFDLAGAAGAWTEQTFTVGLAPGVEYTITINAVAVAVKVDDLWLYFVPMTRAALATRVHTRLGALATDQGYTTTASGALTEGTYTYAVDAGLRQAQAIDPVTAQPDVRYFGTSMIDTLIASIEREMLQQLHRAYTLMADITVGQRTERLSQIATALTKLLETTVTNSRQVRQGRLKRDDMWPYEVYDNGSIGKYPLIQVKDDDGL
jgi:hypothetical protein